MRRVLLLEVSLNLLNQQLIKLSWTSISFEKIALTPDFLFVARRRAETAGSIRKVCDRGFRACNAATDKKD